LGESTINDLLFVGAPHSGGMIDILGLESIEDIVESDTRHLESITKVISLSVNSQYFV